MKKQGTNYKQSGCKDAVWNMGFTIPGKDPNKTRLDASRRVINYNDFGKDNSTGWNIDHKVPSSLGGSNLLTNLQPLQSSYNKSIGNRLNKPNIDSYKGISNDEVYQMYLNDNKK